MQKNIDGILIRLLKLALSAIVLFFFATALMLALARLWLGPELVKSLNNPQIVSTFLSRFEISQDINISVSKAELSWEKWLMPELRISMLTISDKENSLNIAVLENLKVTLGIPNLSTLMDGEVSLDEINLDSLKVYLADDRGESPGTIKAYNPRGANKALFALFHYAGQVQIKKAEIFETNRKKLWSQRILLKTGNINFEHFGRRSLLTLQMMESEELSAIFRYFDFSLQDIYGYRINGVLDKVNISFDKKHLSEYDNINIPVFLKDLIVESSFSELTIENSESKFFANNIEGKFTVKEGLIHMKIFGSETNIGVPSVFPNGEFYFSEITGEIINSYFSFNQLSKQNQNSLAFEIKNFSFKNPEILVTVNGNISPLKSDFFTNLTGDVLFKDPQVVSHYLPKKVGPKTRSWIKKAFISGEEIKGSFEYSGVVGKP